MPNFSDWCLAALEEGKYFPDYNYAGDFIDTDFRLKNARAVFRGSSTGIGVDVLTNMRLKACEMSIGRPDLLDAGLTSKNIKYRKTPGTRELKTIFVKDEWLKPSMSDNEQIRFKYILILDGHSGAFRLSRFLRYNCVLLVAESKYKMWIHNYMIPHVHYIPVKEDLSDLYKVIEWCNDNEENCMKIIARARQLYDCVINIDFMLKYLENILINE
jgi:glycosyl transferase family 90